MEAFKKQLRPKKIKWKEKDVLELAVSTKDSKAFANGAQNMFNKNEDYFVELLGYQLGSTIPAKSEFSGSTIPSPKKGARKAVQVPK